MKFGIRACDLSLKMTNLLAPMARRRQVQQLPIAAVIRRGETDEQSTTRDSGASAGTSGEVSMKGPKVSVKSNLSEAEHAQSRSGSSAEYALPMVQVHSKGADTQPTWTIALMARDGVLFGRLETDLVDLSVLKRPFRIDAVLTTSFGAIRIIEVDGSAFASTSNRRKAILQVRMQKCIHEWMSNGISTVQVEG